MIEELIEDLHRRRDAAYLLLRRYVGLDKRFLLRSDLCDELHALCAEGGSPGLADSPLGRTILLSQEATVAAPWMYAAVRPRIGRWTYLRFHVEAVHVEQVSISEFMAFKEQLVNGSVRADE